MNKISPVAPEPATFGEASEQDQSALAAWEADDDRPAPNRAPAKTDPDTADMRGVSRAGRVRDRLSGEIESMVLFQLSDGGELGNEITADLGILERLDERPLEELVALHGKLATICPDKPRAIFALEEGRRAGGAWAILGPTPVVRRLTTATMFFALLFLATSLSGHINVETMNLSIYELEGHELAIKLLLVTSAAGLGAGFAVLFDVWDDLTHNRFDPIAESANWMRIGLGVVAGLILAEIVNAEPVLVEGRAASGAEGMAPISDTLLALIGGFSATVLHMVMTSVVEGFRRAFNTAGGSQLDPKSVDQIARRITGIVGTSGSSPDVAITTGGPAAKPATHDRADP